MPEVWENGSDKVEIGFSFVSDRLKMFCEFSYQSQLLSYHINLNYFHIISISITCNIQVKVDLYTKTIQYKSSSSFFLR